MKKPLKIKISKEDILKAPTGHKPHKSGSGFHEDKKEGRRSNARSVKKRRSIDEWND